MDDFEKTPHRYSINYSDRVSLTFVLPSYLAVVFATGLAMGLVMEVVGLGIGQFNLLEVLISLVILPLTAMFYFFYLFLPIAVVYFPLYALLHWQNKLSMRWLCLFGALIGALVGIVSSASQTELSPFLVSLGTTFVGAAGCYGAYLAIAWRATLKPIAAS